MTHRLHVLRISSSLSMSVSKAGTEVLYLQHKAECENSGSRKPVTAVSERSKNPYKASGAQGKPLEPWPWLEIFQSEPDGKFLSSPSYSTPQMKGRRIKEEF